MVAVTLVLALGACDWPTFGFDAAHSGASGDTSISAATVAGGLSESWRADLGAFPQDSITSSPVVAKGTVYLGTSDGRVMAFDAKGVTNCTGSGPRSCQPLWASTATSQAITATPAVANGVVYVGTQFGFVEAYDASGVNGCGGTPRICFPIWSSKQFGAFRSSPVVAGNRVYIASTDRFVYAFDTVGTSACTGNCPFRNAYATGARVESSPAVSGSTLYVGSDDHRLYAFDTSGTGCDAKGVCPARWTATTGDVIRSSPAVAGGRVFVGSHDSKLYAFDAAGVTGCSGSPKTCAPLWTGALPGGTDSTPAVSKGVVYIGSTTNGTVAGRINAFDAAGVTNCSGSPVTCQPLWVSNTISIIGSTPVSVANGVVYVVLAVGIFQFRGEIYAFDEAAGNAHCSGTPRVCTPLWFDQPSDGGVVLSGVAVVNGFVYVAGARLHAYAKP